MKLREYAAFINELAKKYPNAKVVYSSDDEGNSFQEIHYHPIEGHFNSGGFEGVDDEKTIKVNAVCIN